MIFIILFISLITRIWYALMPSIIWWDSAMYIGIGKYIYSGGHIGIFEIFRPIGLPLILGFIWKIGLDPFIWGKGIEILSSIGTIYFVYLIGERIQKNVGLYASILLSFSPLFMAFSNAPLSDIPAVFCATIAVYLLYEKKFFLSGFFASLSFLVRFPEALMIIALLGSIFFMPEYVWNEKIKKMFLVGLGFATLSVPYFIVNIFLYKNPFLPIILGNTVALNSTQLHDPHTYLFYIHGLIYQNPFLIFSLLALLPFFIPSKKEFRRHIIPIGICTLIIGGYFSINSHQELRYGISFLPFLCVLAGYGLTKSLNYIPSFKYKHIGGLCFVVCVLLYACYHTYEIYSVRYTSTPELLEYYSYFKDKPGVTILTSSPEMITRSDVTIQEVMDTWEHGDDAYIRGKTSLDYAAINPCETICEDDATCTQAREHFLSTIKDEKIVFNKESQGCPLTIYKIKH